MNRSTSPLRLAQGPCFRSPHALQKRPSTTPAPVQPRIGISARLACQRRAGRLEQECRHSCLAQTEEEREGEEAAAGNVMLWVMRGLGGCYGSD